MLYCSHFQQRMLTFLWIMHCQCFECAWTALLIITKLPPGFALAKTLLRCKEVFDIIVREPVFQSRMWHCTRMCVCSCPHLMGFYASMSFYTDNPIRNCLTYMPFVCHTVFKGKYIMPDSNYFRLHSFDNLNGILL